MLSPTLRCSYTTNWKPAKQQSVTRHHENPEYSPACVRTLGYCVTRMFAAVTAKAVAADDRAERIGQSENTKESSKP